MDHPGNKHQKQMLIRIFVSLILVILLGLVIFEFHLYRKLDAAHAELNSTLTATQEKLASREKDLDNISVLFAELEQKYAFSEESGAELYALLNQEREVNEGFKSQIKDISGTLGKLDKLSKIDPELLQKYSKVYFLNEHYAPEKLTEIDPAYVAQGVEKQYINSRISRFLSNLLEDAKDDGIDLKIRSAYRSFDEQSGLKNGYLVQYGTGANAFSADQGYSEHQLGTTVDFTSTEVNGTLVTGFKDTKAYTWLLRNAHKYGFTLSYPEGNAYYVYEPWHWRFVGEDLADDLRDDGKHFYDLDQRKLDSYLINIFD